VTNWLLLHGTPLTPSVWDAVIPALREHGAVAAPAVIAGIGPVTDVQRALAGRVITADVDVPPPWHVVGHSFGGQVALEIALQRPDLVTSLTLLCTRDTPYPSFAATAAYVKSGSVDVDGSLRRWFSPAELAADGPVVRYARDAVASADRVKWANALSSIAVFDVSEAISAISCPAVAVAAAHDGVSDPQAMADMAARLLHGELRVLDDAWHMSVFTDPNQLARLIISSAGRSV
jgi:pimeloyl-ACP methyl ester carboxylesterase